MEEFYKLYIEYLTNADKYPKNQCFCNYDMDTIIGIPNAYNVGYDSYWDNKKGYCNYEYDEWFESKRGMSPRGEWYHLVLVRNGKIIAFGEEQGNYAGGIYAANDFNYERFLKGKEELKNECIDLYEQIKDIPLAEKNEFPMYKNKNKNE